MNRENRMNAEQYLLSKRRKKIWQNIVIALACVVVFCTTYALILPAITQENEVSCGMEVHEHTEACYTQLPETAVRQQICTTEVHVHTESCLDENGATVCGQADYLAHTHGELCTNEDGSLICTLEERSAHSHTEACWQTVETVIPAVIHSHTEDCRDETDALICGYEEGAVISEETVTTEETLICTEPVAQEHVHVAECFQTVNPEAGLTCTLEENDTHTHGDMCYGTWELSCGMAEHTHSLACYADPTADLETAEDWEKSFADAELTGLWAEDVIVIAQTQLGYQESTRNYIVLEDGVSTKGYTRYGAWYGDPYGDWCAMFLSFCLDYAGVEDMPLDSNCPNWIAELTEAGLYQPQGSWVPEAGNLIFFDWNADGSSDHVGIVTQVAADEESGVLQISTIEGNSGNRVQSKTYTMDDATIQGYGILPVQLTEEEQIQVESVIAMIDVMPSADEIDAKLAEFEEAEDYEGEEAWYTEVAQQVAEAYYYYSQLSDAQKSKVTNADKLLELEYIWSVTPYIDDIASDAPTTDDYTSTSEFVELNLYDYNYNINSWWNEDKKYPGFQWNGGAYSKTSYRYSDSTADLGVPNYTTDRNRIDSIDFGNSMITNFNYGNTSDYAKSNNAVGVGYLYDSTTAINGNTGKINWLWYDPDVTNSATNRPVGLSTGYQSISNTLVDGYPALSDGTSLSFLFGDETADIYNAVTKQNTESIDGLFLQDPVSGEYSYNSRENHAQYSNNFFTRYDQIITPNFITYPFGNFLPLNTISDLTKATQVGAFNYAGGMEDYVDAIKADLNEDIATYGTDDWKYTTRKQLLTMLDEYAENWDYYTYNGSWSEISPANAIRDYFQMDGDNPSEDVSFVTQEHLDNMYNIDWDVDTNFFFGMEMKMTFMQPKNGYTGNDANGDGASDYPMVFYFTGDDDVWVYVDGVLFLDLTGIHRHVGGEIDFVNGKVHYYELSPGDTGDVKGTAYKTYTFAQLLSAAGKSTDVLNENGTFKDYTSHSFNFYYMERGSGSSVCRLNFNFPLLRKNTISVSKENVTTDGVAADEVVVGNPDYYFNLMAVNDAGATTGLFVGPNSETGITQYKVEDSDGNILKNADGTDKIFTTDEYGIFTLKAGQTALFEGIEENECEYYVQELIKEEDNNQYPLVYVNGTISQYNKLIDWSGRSYFSDNDSDNYTGPYGYKWYGRSGYYTDPSTNSAFHFTQQNRLDVAKLGKLQITKELIEAVPSRAITYYRMHVTLDGEPLPEGTTYDVDGQTRTVTEAGYIELAPGETATISNVISGTKFEVYEDAASAAGYTVTYEATGASNVQYNGSSISGVIHIGSSDTSPLVSVKVTNSDSGVQVQIPVTKSFSKSDELNREFIFVLEQVDQDGNVIDGGTNLSTTIATPTATTGNFELTYFARDLDTGQTKLYYKITEVPVEGSLPNTQAFIAEVTVTKTAGSGTMTAVSKIYPLGSTAEVASADFVNTLTGDLSLEKTVVGSTETQQNEAFNFTIALDPGDSGVALKDRYPATVTQANGDTLETSYGVTNGVISINDVHHGESVVIHDLPIGTQWTIEEAKADGYSVTTSVSVNGAEATAGIGTSVSGSVVTGSTAVVYTNSQMYELPETGGAGVTLYTMAGLMLMLCSMAFLLYRYQKRRKEVQ